MKNLNLIIWLALALIFNPIKSTAQKLGNTKAEIIQILKIDSNYTFYQEQKTDRGDALIYKCSYGSIGFYFTDAGVCNLIMDLMDKKFLPDAFKVINKIDSVNTRIDDHTWFSLRTGVRTQILMMGNDPVFKILYYKEK